VSRQAHRDRTAPLAIKVLKKDADAYNATIQRFIQEAKARRASAIPTSSTSPDFGKTPDGTTYSVMEYVEGTTLSKAIKEHAPMPAARAVRIAMQIARALAPRTAKASSTAISSQRTCSSSIATTAPTRQDVDFGIAKDSADRRPARGPRSPAGAVFGTPEYMAPSRLRSRRHRSPRRHLCASAASSTK